jgi:hypothetical protein
MKTKLILLLAAGFFAIGISATTEDNFEAIDENGELVLSEENSELFLGRLGELLGSAAGKAVDVLIATKDWVKGGLSSAKDLVKSGYSKAASLAEEMGLTKFIKDIPLKVLQSGEEAIIQFLFSAGKTGLSFVGGVIKDTVTSGVSSAIAGTL